LGRAGWATSIAPATHASTASSIFLDVAGVSCRHARIVVGEHAVLLEDLGSKNGTSRDGEPVKQKVTLHDGNRIQVGPILIIYHASATGISTETVVDSVTRRRTKR
jgi:pSer/pThr/pTyr-binding forkhead associated (FHA) protein